MKSERYLSSCIDYNCWKKRVPAGSLCKSTPVFSNIILSVMTLWGIKGKIIRTILYVAIVRIIHLWVVVTSELGSVRLRLRFVFYVSVLYVFFLTTASLQGWLICYVLLYQYQCQCKLQWLISEIDYNYVSVALILYYSLTHSLCKSILPLCLQKV